jgi:hypothetical protein
MNDETANRSALNWIHGHLTRQAEWELTRGQTTWTFRWRGGLGVLAEEFHIAESGALEPTGGRAYIPLIPSAASTVDEVQQQIALWIAANIKS